MLPERERLKDRLVQVEEGGLLSCVDGRKVSGGKKLRAPKILGGVLGVAAQGLGKGENDVIGEEDIRMACRKVRKAGFTPTIHGDKKHGERGCGFGKLWSDGKLTGVPKLGLSLDEVKQIVLEEEGEYIEYEGEHNEQFTVLNYVEDMTLEPDGSCFIADIWAADRFDIDKNEMESLAGQVVEKLDGPDSVEIIR